MYSNLNYYQNNFENTEEDYSSLPNYISNHKKTSYINKSSISSKTPVSDIVVEKADKIDLSPKKSSNNDNLLPVLDPVFNLREIAKQCILLEDHLSQKEKNCTDCIIKHFLTLEALSEEAITLDAHNQHNIENLPAEFRNLQKKWYEKETPNHNISQNIRKIRKNIMIDSFPIVFSENAIGCSVDGKKCIIKNDN